MIRKKRPAKRVSREWKKAQALYFDLVLGAGLAAFERLIRDRGVSFEDLVRLVQEGTHRQLLDQGAAGRYGRLWHHQSGGFLVE